MPEFWIYTSPPVIFPDVVIPPLLFGEFLSILFTSSVIKLPSAMRGVSIS